MTVGERKGGRGREKEKQDKINEERKKEKQDCRVTDRYSTQGTRSNEGQLGRGHALMASKTCTSSQMRYGESID